MKVQVKRAFKSYFLSPKTIREQTGSALNFLQPFKFSSTVNYHPSPWSLQNISWIFSETCISHHGCKNFQIYGVKITGKYICESIWLTLVKLNLFTHAPKQSSPSGFHHHHSREKEITISPKQSVLKIYFSPAERGRTM